MLDIRDISRVVKELRARLNLSQEELAAKLGTPIESLDLTVRAGNCLESINVNVIGDLVKMTESDLLKVRSFGKTSLREISRKLSDMGLALGMSDAE